MACDPELQLRGRLVRALGSALPPAPLGFGSGNPEPSH
jgi:hypothetical protein